MAQPVWITPSGDLGRISEDKYFSTQVQAADPDGGPVYYKLVAGVLPDGVQVKINGNVEGIPKNIVDVNGVPAAVGEDVTSKFVVRAYTLAGTEIAYVHDRTFEITITGQDLPEFITPAGLLGVYVDGNVVSIPIEFTDNDPGDVITISIIKGSLPEGLTLLPSGKIVGYIKPVAELSIHAIAGWDRLQTDWDEFPYDFTTRSSNKHYPFSIQITDGKNINVRDFSIFVVAKNNLTATSTGVTVDNSTKIDTSTTRIPFLLDFDNTTTDLGIFRHDNWFAYKFEALDLDGEPIGYTVTSPVTGLPSGLTFDTQTGWLSGNISNIGIAKYTYEFSVQLHRINSPTIVSAVYHFTITIVGGVDDEIVWTTDSFLGSIDNGSTSLFKINAVSVKTPRDIKYRLKSGGVYQRLPVGLSLLDDGSIVGRVTFNTYTLDSGTTTFDNELSTRLKRDRTTVDMNYNFTIEAYTVDMLLSINKTFTIAVKRTFNEPYESLYALAMPMKSAQQLVDDLLTNTTIIPRDLVYRPNDPNFGISSRIQYVHAYGIQSSTLDQYVHALETNHYRKTLVLGDLAVARALDENDNVVYDVIYANIVDPDSANKDKTSYQISWPTPVNVNNTSVTDIYLNGLTDMRNLIISQLGQYKSTLPLWMTSTQENGQVLSFVECWPIVYCNPGKGKQVLYNIQQKFGKQLNQIDFTVDRWIVGKQFSKNWNASGSPSIDGAWDAASVTSFDNRTTTFDNDSIKFISPVDLIGATDQYDKYIMFPRTNILG